MVLEVPVRKPEQPELTVIILNSADPGVFEFDCRKMPTNFA